MTEQDDDPEITAEIEAMAAMQRDLFARPETKYLMERGRAGLLTPDERAQLAAVLKFVETGQEWASLLIAEDLKARPLIERLGFRLRRSIRRAMRRGTK
jgi:hypothetical protein